MKKSLSIIEKVAMIWTFPIMLIAFAGISIITISLVLISQILNFSGTIGASIYLFENVKSILAGRSLKKLLEEDEKKHNFDS
jgi:hypothetical protein